MGRFDAVRMTVIAFALAGIWGCDKKSTPKSQSASAESSATEKDNSAEIEKKVIGEWEARMGEQRPGQFYSLMELSLRENLGASLSTTMPDLQHPGRSIVNRAGGQWQAEKNGITVFLSRSLDGRPIPDDQQELKFELGQITDPQLGTINTLTSPDRKGPVFLPRAFVAKQRSRTAAAAAKVVGSWESWMANEKPGLSQSRMRLEFRSDRTAAVISAVPDPRRPNGMRANRLEGRWSEEGQDIVVRPEKSADGQAIADQMRELRFTVGQLTTPEAGPTATLESADGKGQVFVPLAYTLKRRTPAAPGSAPPVPALPTSRSTQN